VQEREHFTHQPRRTKLKESMLSDMYAELAAATRQPSAPALPLIIFQRTTNSVNAIKKSGPPANFTAASVAGVGAPSNMGCSGPKVANQKWGAKIAENPSTAWVSAAKSDGSPCGIVTLGPESGCKDAEKGRREDSARGIFVGKKSYCSLQEFWHRNI